MRTPLLNELTLFDELYCNSGNNNGLLSIFLIIVATGTRKITKLSKLSTSDLKRRNTGSYNGDRYI